MRIIFKLFKLVLLLLGAFILITVAIFAFGYFSMSRLPGNTPKDYLSAPREPGKKVVVCIGDSITHGRVGHNYVAETRSRFTRDEFEFVNAGINSEFAYNIAERLDEIIQCQPDIVTILIGSNDAMYFMKDSEKMSVLKGKGLNRKVDKAWFEENLTRIVKRLKNETNARIALLTLPPISEDLNSPSFARAIEYSNVIRQVAATFRVDLLPLNETLRQRLTDFQNQQSVVLTPPAVNLMNRAVFMRYILRYDWDEISDKHNQRFLVDESHLNHRGALVVADLIEGYIRSIE